MNTLSFCVINGLIGAAIGAGTNELAVRWIFWKLIPSKKEQLAGTVRDVVAEELLTHEKIADKINSNKVRGIVAQNLSEWFNNVLESELPSLDELATARNIDLSPFTRRLTVLLTEEIHVKLSEPAFVSNIVGKYIAGEIDDIFRKKPNEIFTDLDEIVEKVPERINEFLQEKENKQRITGVISKILLPVLKSERSFGDFIPANLHEEIVKMFHQQIPVFTEKIAEFLETPNIQTKFKSNIKSALENYLKKRTPSLLTKAKNIVDNVLKINIGEVISKKVGLDKEIDEFCSEIPKKMREEVAGSDFNQDLEKLIEELSREFFSTNMKDLFSALNENSLQKEIDRFYDEILTGDACLSIGKEIQEVLKEALNRSVQENLEKMRLPVSKEKAVDVINVNLTKSLASDRCKTLIKDEIAKFIEGLKSRKIGQLKKIIKPNTQKKFIELARDLAIETFIQQFKNFTETSGIWDIIKESIMSYDDKEIERLVRKIANRELRWVTIMGGIIGLIIGIVQGFLINL